MSEKLTMVIEATDEWLSTTLGKCRVWKGMTGGGVPISAAVATIYCDKAHEGAMTLEFADLRGPDGQPVTAKVLSTGQVQVSAAALPEGNPAADVAQP